MKLKHGKPSRKAKPVESTMTTKMEHPATLKRMKRLESSP